MSKRPLYVHALGSGVMLLGVGLYYTVGPGSRGETRLDLLVRAGSWFLVAVGIFAVGLGLTLLTRRK